METRKVQLSGGTTYTVSLPKAWAQEQGIDAGSVLALRPNGDGSLLIEATGDRSQSDRSATVDVSTDAPGSLRQRVEALYAVGFDSVTLLDTTQFTDEGRSVVKDAVRELSGFQVLSVTDTRVQLTNLIDAENVDVRKATLRLRLVTLAMHRDAVDAVLADDTDLAKQVIERDSEADKLFAMITRHFRRALTDLYELEKLGYDRDQLFEYYYVSRQLERIADHAVKMAKFVEDPGGQVPDEFVDEIESLAADSRTVIDTASDVILADADIETAYSALDRRDDLNERVTQLDRKLYTYGGAGEAYVTGLLLDSVRRSGEYGANIARIGIERVVREGLDESRK